MEIRRSGSQPSVKGRNLKMGSFPFDVAFSAVAPAWPEVRRASCRLFCFCLSYRWPPAGAFNFLPVGARHAVLERPSCTSTPSTHRPHPAWRLCFSSSTGNPACASVPPRRTPQYLATPRPRSPFSPLPVLLTRAQREGGPIEEIRPGDVVWISPAERHWHGASPTTAMTHIAIQEKLDGKVDWMEQISDEQYQGVT
jgi:hypothetical protein